MLRPLSATCYKRNWPFFRKLFFCSTWREGWVVCLRRTDPCCNPGVAGPTGAQSFRGMSLECPGPLPDNFGRGCRLPRARRDSCAARFRHGEIGAIPARGFRSLVAERNAVLGNGPAQPRRFGKRQRLGSKTPDSFQFSHCLVLWA